MSVWYMASECTVPLKASIKPLLSSSPKKKKFEPIKTWSVSDFSCTWTVTAGPSGSGQSTSTGEHPSIYPGIVSRSTPCWVACVTTLRSP